MTENKKPRGGSRPGAGRPTLGEETKPVSVQIPTAHLQAIAGLNLPIPHFVREAVKEKLIRDKALSLG